MKLDCGHRVSIGGHKATVRFTGEVPPTKGAWVGVEWDDPSRGKHNGTYEGKEYFSVAAAGPTAASFVRERKLDAFISIEDAVRERYGGKIGEDEHKDVWIDAKQQSIAVEFVGADKAHAEQSQLDQLSLVSVRDSPTAGPADINELAQLIPSVAELDLSNTLISSWEIILKMASLLPKLYSIRLVNNRIGRLTDSLVSTVEPATRVTELYLSLSPTAPTQIGLFAKMFPSISELHLGGNKITSLADCTFPPSLKILNLEDNLISKWEEVASLGDLPQLKELCLARNQLTQIQHPGEGHFLHLSSLDLSRNKLADWKDTIAISRFSRITELKIGNNSFQGRQQLHVRQILIARLENLIRLNKTEIRKQERIIAERFYLTEYAKHYWSQKMSNADAMEFASLHPDFARLIELHGEPDKPHAASVALKEGFVSLVGLTFDGKASKKIHIPAVTKVAKLRQVLQAKKIIRPRLRDPPRLFIQPTVEGGVEIELDDDMRDLQFFEIKSGTIVIRD